jgi:hypothetical protein
MRQVMLKGSGFSDVSPQFVIIAVMAILINKFSNTGKLLNSLLDVRFLRLFSFREIK